MNKQKSGKVKNLSVKLLAFFVFALIFMLTFITVREVFNKSKLDGEIVELNDEIKRLKIKQEGFLSLIDTYQNDFYLEQEARSKLNLKKEGEKVVVVELNDVNLINSSESENYLINTAGATRQNKPTNVVLWWDYFFGLSG